MYIISRPPKLLSCVHKALLDLSLRRISLSISLSPSLSLALSLSLCLSLPLSHSVSLSLSLSLSLSIYISIYLCLAASNRRDTKSPAQKVDDTLLSFHQNWLVRTSVRPTANNLFSPNFHRRNVKKDSKKKKAHSYITESLENKCSNRSMEV